MQGEYLEDDFTNHVVLAFLFSLIFVSIYLVPWHLMHAWFKKTFEARLWKTTSEEVPLLYSLMLASQPCEVCASATPLRASMRLVPHISSLFGVSLDLEFNFLCLLNCYYGNLKFHYKS